MAWSGQNFIYSLSTDNVAPLATVAVNTGTVDPTYPAANLIDLNPARPAQLTTTTGSWVFTFPAPQRLDVFSIVMHNLSAGLDVQLQGNATNVWTAPSLTRVIQIPTYREDGFPYNPWVDLTATHPLVANRTFTYWRLLVNGANAAPVKVGEVWMLGTKRHLKRNIMWGSSRFDVRPGVIHETDYLVKLKYDYGVLRRKLSVNIENTDESLIDVLAWGRSCRWAMRPTLIVPNPDVNDAWLVNFALTEQDWERTLLNYNNIALDFEEMSRGLVL